MLKDHAFGEKSLFSSLIPISRFNRGEASKIFDEVKRDGVKVVLKNNNPACVLLTPERYEKLMELVEDVFLFEEAEKRLADVKGAELLPFEKVLESHGITEADLKDFEDLVID